MAENNNQNQGSDKLPDKGLKPKFNTNWIFAILAISIIAFQLLYGGRSVPKAQTRDLKEMIKNHDIERIVIINKEVAEIYLKKDAIDSKSTLGRQCEGYRPARAHVAQAL